MTNANIPSSADDYNTQQSSYGYPAPFEYPGQDGNRSRTATAAQVQAAQAQAAAQAQMQQQQQQQVTQQPHQNYSSYQYPQPATPSQPHVGFPTFGAYPQYRGAAGAGVTPASPGTQTAALQPASYGGYYTTTGQYPNMYQPGAAAAAAAAVAAAGPVQNQYAAPAPVQYPAYTRPDDGLQRSVMKPKITTTMWEDEKTLCYQVEANGVIVVRRADNDMINGTKLLNVTKMTRGRRDGILKAEKVRHVVKIGSLHLKGIWIPFDRALAMARREGIHDMLFPLFVKDIAQLIQQGTPVESSPAAVVDKADLSGGSGNTMPNGSAISQQSRYEFRKREQSTVSVDENPVMAYNTYKPASTAQQQPLYYLYPGYQMQHSATHPTSSGYLQRPQQSPQQSQQSQQQPQPQQQQQQQQQQSSMQRQPSNVSFYPYYTQVPHSNQGPKTSIPSNIQQVDGTAAHMNGSNLGLSTVDGSATTTNSSTSIMNNGTATNTNSTNSSNVSGSKTLPDGKAQTYSTA